MKSIAGGLLAFALGIMAARWNVISHGNEPAAQRDDAEMEPRRILPRASRTSQSALGPVSSAACGQAWNALQQQSPSDRALTTPLLLAEWAKVDLDAALEAALSSENPEHLLDVFQDVFEENPEALLRVISNERFGLKTALARDWWIQKMGAKDPEALLDTASDFGPVDRAKAVKTAFASLSVDEARSWSALDKLLAMPDSDQNQKLWSHAAEALAETMDPNFLMAKLSEIRGLAGDVMIAKALVVMLDKTDYNGARQSFSTLPPDLKPRIVQAALSHPSKNVQAYIAALDEVIHTPAWKQQYKSLAVKLHDMPKERSHTAALQKWALSLPEREDTEDLYRVALRSMNAHQPNDARVWIEQLPSGWKQQNALTGFVQSALSTRGDLEGAQWAMQKINDPHFLQQAQGFLDAFQKARQNN